MYSTYLNVCTYTVRKYYFDLWRVPVLASNVNRKFLGLPDPDPFIIKQKSKKNLDFCCFVTSYDFVFENWCKSTFKKQINLRKKLIFLLVSFRKEKDPDLEVCGADPDPYQNVTDPQHWYRQERGYRK